MVGVGKGKIVRSPYAITAMEHNGKQAFRVRWVSACLFLLPTRPTVSHLNYPFT